MNRGRFLSQAVAAGAAVLALPSRVRGQASAYRVGRSIRFDGATERFVGDAEADALPSRTCRALFVLPDKT